MVYVRTLFFICCLQSILHNSYQSQEYYGCEDVNGLIYKLTFLNAVDALNLITLPLECSTCPTQVRQLRQNLLLLVTQGRVDIRSIVLNLKNYGDHNRNDILLTTLLAINENTNLPANIRFDISNVLFYLLKKRFLRQDDFANARNGFDIRINPWDRGQIGVPANLVFPNRCGLIFDGNLVQYPRRPYGSNVGAPNDHSKCHGTAIRALLEKLLELEKHWDLHSTICPSARIWPSPHRLPEIPFPRPSIQPRPSYWPHVRPIYYVPDNMNFNIAQIQRQIQLTMQQLRIRVQGLIQLIPDPIYPKERIMYERLKKLLQSPLVLDLLKSLNVRQYRTDAELFDVIITTILHTVHTQEIREVFSFWKNYQGINQIHFNFALLLDAIPRPKTLKEQGYYNLMQQLFTSKVLYQMVPSASFYQTTDITQKLIIVLTELIQSHSVSSQVLEAANYYHLLIDHEQTGKAFGELVTVLPEPENETELKNFNLLKQLLNSRQLYVVTEHLTNLTTTEKLTYILKTIITNNEYSQYGPVAIYYRDRLARQRFGFSYFNLLNLLPVTPESRVHTQTLAEYFYSVEFETILSSLQISTLSDTDKLIQILQAVQETSSSTPVVQASVYFLQQIQLQVFDKNMNNIIAILPQPKEPNEIAKYNIVKSFLLSQQAYDMLKQIDISIFPTTRLLLDFILKTVVESNIDATIKDAAEYYIDLYDRLQALDLITKKEIKKKFKLTEIFLDTLHPDALTLSQKDAFKKFFKYISQIQPEALSHFDSWDQAQTRGQFMKLLFQYLLEQPATHPEIKSCIIILDSLVVMDGKGALPP